MASPSTKRPAPFDEDEKTSKRPRRDEPPPTKDRGSSRGTDQARNSHRSNRSRSRSPKQDSRSRGTYRDRGGPPNGTSKREPPRGPAGDHARERSPRRERRRDRSRDRSRERTKTGREDGRKGSPSNSRPAPEKAPPSQSKPPVVNGSGGKMDVDSEEDPEGAALARVMGFKSFKTTKNTKVPGNDKLYAVRKEKTTEYRQYMNRVGGFNRPLSPS